MTNLAKRILPAVRSNLAYQAIQNTCTVDMNNSEWQRSNEVEETPTTSLNHLMAKVANLCASVQQAVLPQASLGADYTSTFENRKILSGAKCLDGEFIMWTMNLPSEWEPISISAKHLPPSIVQAGCYGDHYDIYNDIMVCSTWNDWRVARLKILAMQVCYTLGSERALVIEAIQGLSDAICASIPFCLGSRMLPAPLHAQDMDYPSLPGKGISKYHYRTAAAYGGWYLLAPMKQVLALGAYLRQGQSLWIALQLRRLARIYNVVPLQQ